MSITVKTRTWVVIALSLLLATFFSGWHFGCLKEDRANKATIASMAKAISRYEIEVNDTKLYIAEKDQEVLSLREAIKKGFVEREYYRKLHLKSVDDVTYLQAQVDILNDSIAHTGNVIVVQPCDSAKKEKLAIELPFTFARNTEYYNISGGFDLTGTMNFDLNVPMELTVWSGIDKDTKTFKAVVASTNPYVTITNIQSLKLDLPRVKRFGIGVFGGYGLNLLGGTIKAQPLIGVGLSYNIIRF